MDWWEKQIQVETVKAIIVAKTPFREDSYTNFYNLLQQNTKLLTYSPQPNTNLMLQTLCVCVCQLG
jgi:hypothetical protein